MLIRRLLMLVAVLLGLTVIVAAVAPRPETRDSSRQPPAATSTPSARAEPGSAPPPATPRDELEALGLDRQFTLRTGAKPQRLRTKLGEELRLTVSARSPNSVEIPGLDVSEAVDPEAPLELELRMERAGRFPITLGPGGPPVGVLDVAAG